jgi:hypothetical protein
MNQKEAPVAIPSISQSHQKAIDALRRELFGNDNTIPTENVTGKGNYKVRGNWFQGALDALQFTALIADEEGWTENQTLQDLLPAITSEADRLRHRNQSNAPGRQDSFVRTTAEEIDRVDAWLVEFLQVALRAAGELEKANAAPGELKNHASSFRVQIETAIAAK